MSETAARRPPILTGACIYLGALSAIIAIRAISVVSSWNAENRAADFAGVLKVLRDAGLGAAGAETFYKSIVTVIAVLAACAAVFAAYVTRAHRASRVGLTVTLSVAAVFTFLGVLGGTLLFAMVGALAVVFTIRLWTGEIGSYFRTLAGHEPAVAPTPKVDPFASAQLPAGPVRPATETTVIQPPAQSQVHPPQSYPPPYRVRERMPRSVSIAVWTAFVGSITVAALSALMLLSLALIGDDYEQLMRDSPMSGLVDQSSADYDQQYRQLLTIFGVCLPLALAGLAASIVPLAKRHAGNTFLFVMAAVTVPASIVLVPILGLPWTAAAIVCLVQLRKPGSKAWFSRT